MLWARYCGATACKGRSNERCRGGPFDGRGASIDVTNELRSGPDEGRARARGDCIQSRGRNAYVSYTNYLRRTHARTHRPTVTPLAHPPSYTHARTGTHCTAPFSLLVFFFLLLRYTSELVSRLSVNSNSTSYAHPKPNRLYL